MPAGKDALEKIQKDKYDLIFMDHLMPVIILTANAILGAWDEYIQAGFADYLSKPIQEKELNAVLLKYLPQEKLSFPVWISA